MDSLLRISLTIIVVSFFHCFYLDVYLDIYEDCLYYSFILLNRLFSSDSKAIICTVCAVVYTV